MLDRLMREMLSYYGGDPRRGQHFIKVHSLAKTIAAGEGLDDDTRFVLEAAALTHDIGIRAAEEALGHSNGKLQETMGPAPAREMLTRLGFSEPVIERVCWLIAHHHTYSDVEGLDYQILLEADFLVNLYEDAVGKGLSMAKARDEGNPAARSMREAAAAAYEKIFRTETGKQLCREMFAL